jgi:hypothetical protein
MDDQTRLLKLDAYYAVKLHDIENGELSGELVRLEASESQTATHLFDVPAQSNEQAVKEWAARALQAYREG